MRSSPENIETNIHSLTHARTQQILTLGTFASRLTHSIGTSYNRAA